MDITYLLIPVLIGLICGIAGYFIGKMNSRKDDTLSASLQSDLDVCYANTKNLLNRIKALETDLAFKTKTHSANHKHFVLFDSETATVVMGKRIKENDMKIIEGIGIKIESLFHHSGITTWYELSETPAEKLQSVLDAGGENYAIHNPITWPKQASLAYQGKWKELKDLQENLLSGKE
ncbi:hypothetical protein [Flavobacterium foetidum]|uniref:hypothetical protein n=1 Tax=Flavobacterium foetidum TaxID=2026681 RepID=UPI0010753B9B|nr:hypothetical protein [Flavobacterium foetidum]KAF2513906.1 hypothetical protein E0W73_13850 [Flavobacterium foetidum]